MIEEEQFKEMVNNDIRGQGQPEEAEMLRSPEHVRRWYNTLLSLKRKAEYNISSKRADLLRDQHSLLTENSEEWRVEWIGKKADFEVWKQGTMRFRNGVEDKLAEAKTLLNPDNSNAVEAIRRHRDEIASGEVDADEEDERLWSVVE